jgi:hypothetical protein
VSTSANEVEQASQRRMADQWEIGKKLYAAHSLLVSAPPLDRQKIVSFLNQALLEFMAAGGHAQTGTDVFGERGPVLSCENGDIIPYEAGRVLGEQFISSGVFR